MCIDGFTRYGFIAVMLVLLAACVQPFEPTPVPQPTPASTPTPIPPPPTVEVGSTTTFPPDTVAAWFQQNLGVAMSGVTVFTQFDVGPDHVVGFSFQDVSAQNCAGFVLTSPGTTTIWNGDYRCAAPGTQIIVGSLLFALTNNEFYVATFGAIDPNTLPNAGGVAATYPDGSNSTQLLSNNGFLMLKPGLALPNLLTVTNNTNGDTLAQLPLQ